MSFMQLCAFHAISIKILFLVIWLKALPHGMEVVKHSISVKFCEFSHNSPQNFSELGPSALCRWGNRKHEICVALDIPFNFHHEYFFINWHFSPLPLFHGGGVAKISFMYSSGHPKQFLGKYFCKLTSTPHPLGWSCEDGFSVEIWTFHSILNKPNFWERTLSSPQSYL